MPEPVAQRERGILAVVGEFATPESAARTARRLRRNGYGNLDAFGPFPSEELADAIGFHEHRMAPAVLGGGIVGGLCGFALQYYTTVIAYPHNVGGRPHFSWPSYIPITFECTILLGTLTGIAMLFILCRLPRLAHPIFSAANFERATTDRFFLTVNARAPEFSVTAVRAILNEEEPPLSISVLTSERKEEER